MCQIKYTIEKDNQSVKLWVDEVSGALCIQGTDQEIIEIPADTGFDIVSILRQKQALFAEKNKKKWKFIDGIY